MALAFTVRVPPQAETLTDFPLYISLTDAPAEFWASSVLNGGGDIRCYAADGTTELPREVVSCDTSAQTGELHVKVTLSSTVWTHVQIHTDGTSSEPAVTSTYGAQNVWSDYELVSHDTLTDSSGNHTLTAQGDVSSNSSGPMGSGAVFDGVDDWVEIPTTVGDALAANDAFTLQGWANLDTLASDQAIVGDWQGSSSTESNLLYMDADGAAAGYRSVMRETNTTVHATSADASGAVVDTWQLAHSTFSGANTRLRAYTDGSETDENTGASSNVADVSSTWYIGRRADLTTEVDGELAEIRIRADELSANWIATEYANQSSPTTFYVQGFHKATLVIPKENTNSLTDFPVYADLSDMPQAFHDAVAPDGGDIRIFKGDTELPREVVSYKGTELTFDGVDDNAVLDSTVTLSSDTNDKIAIWFTGMTQQSSRQYFVDGTGFNIYIGSGNSRFNWQGNHPATLNGEAMTENVTTLPENSDAVHKLEITVNQTNRHWNYIGSADSDASFLNGGILRITVERNGAIIHDWDARNISGTTWTDSVGGNNATIGGGATTTATETGELHFKTDLTSLDTAENVFDIYVDGVSADYAVDATYGRNAVWSDYVGVWHLGDASTTDSSGNGHDITWSDAPDAGTEASPWGGATSNFNGTSDYGTIADSADLSLMVSGTESTVQAWFRPDTDESTISGESKIFDKEDEWLAHVDDDPNFLGGGVGDDGARFSTYGDNNIDAITKDVVVSSWNKLDWVIDAGTQIKTLVNASSSGTLTSSDTSSDQTTLLYVGAEHGGVDFLDGHLGMLRIANSQLSDNWIATEYANQSSPSTFYQVGTDASTLTHAADITIDADQVDGDVDDFPVYVDLSDMPDSFHDSVLPNAKDVRVYKEGGSVELPVEVVSYRSGASHTYDGNSYMASSSLGDILSNDSVRVEMYDCGFDVSATTGYIFSQASTNAAKRELGLYLTSNSSERLKLYAGGSNNVIASATELTARYGDAVDGYFAFEINMQTGAWSIEDDQGLWKTGTATVGTGKEINNYFFRLGGRSNSGVSDSTASVGFTFANGTGRFGDTLVYVDGVLERKFIADGTNTDSVPDLENGEDGTLYNAASDGSQWTGTPKTGELHFKHRGTLSSSVDTVVEVYTGATDAYAATDGFGRNMVWSDYEFVSHDGVADSTGNNTLSSTTGVSTGSVGKIGDAVSVTSDPSDLGATSSTTSAFSELTLQAWNYIDGVVAGGPNELLSLGGTSNGAALYYRTGSDTYHFDTSVTSELTTTTTRADSSQQWTMLHGVLSGSGDAIYADGASEDSSASSGTVGTHNGEIGLGNDGGSGSIVAATEPLINTRIDEARVRYSALSANWISTEYTNQNTPTTFYTITDPNAGGDTNVSVSSVSFTLSPLAAAVAGTAPGVDTNVDAALQTLTLTEQAASVSVDVSVDAGVQTLTLTEQGASISSDVNVGVGTQALSLTELSASISQGSGVSVGTANFTLSTYPATLGQDTNVAINSATLTLEPQAATVSNDINVTTGVVGYTLNEFTATIQNDVEVSVASESLSFASYTATLSYDVEVTTAANSYSLATLQATIGAGAQRQVVSIIGVPVTSIKTIY